MCSVHHISIKHWWLASKGREQKVGVLAEREDARFETGIGEICPRHRRRWSRETEDQVTGHVTELRVG